MINKEKLQLRHGSRWHQDCTCVTSFPHLHTGHGWRGDRSGQNAAVRAGVRGGHLLRLKRADRQAKRSKSR